MVINIIISLSVPFFETQRRRYVHAKYLNRPNYAKFTKLMNSYGDVELTKLIFKK